MHVAALLSLSLICVSCTILIQASSYYRTALVVSTISFPFHRQEPTFIVCMTNPSSEVSSASASALPVSPTIPFAAEDEIVRQYDDDTSAQPKAGKHRRNRVTHVKHGFAIGRHDTSNVSVENWN